MLARTSQVNLEGEDVMKWSLAVVFWSLIGLVAVAVGMSLAGKRVDFPFKVALIVALSLLGSAVLFLTLRQEVGGALKVFLILAGTAPAAMIVSVVLHNVVSGLLTALLNRTVEEPVFFLIAVFGCPAAFLAGVIGSIVLIIRGIILE